ncbi:hypothetical protein DFH08DRAFT_815174 [Mycena albidolilacea]|uniref:Uncharacterized protein n=1 Tax=Mycena albidolilacea TaxID=1033008 RepID=A0AAD6ZNQ8_9AGAR|nr:hypothetical protein DFH08DRAFT_815174 [Mycena albidolilacea]
MAKSTNSKQKHCAAPMNRRVKVPVTVRDAHGRASLKLQVLTTQARTEIQQRTQMEIEEQERASTRKTMNNIHDIPDEEGDEWQDDDGDFTYGDVIDGAVPIDISHGGGEMQDMAQALSDDLHGKARWKRQDTRYWSDVVQRRVLGFRAQMKEMVDAYMAFSAAQGRAWHGTGPVSLQTIWWRTSSGHYIASCLVGQGLIPCSPWKPKQAVSIRVLEMFRLARLRCPALGVQAWIKTLADLHGTAFKPYSAQRFTICFDLYLEILDNAEKHVKTALGRNAPDWRLKNGCPACTYKLKGEDKLIFRHAASHGRKDKGFNEDGVAHRGDSERADPRAADAGGDYLMSCERVDRWAKERLAEEVGIPISDEPENSSGCEERWKNLTEELTAKMAKYPLAIVNALLDAFGADLGIGYDIGCGHSTTIRHSPLGPKAARLNLKMLVGAFHGHAHNRKCQLDYLATYVLGLGLEDLEGAERLFSRSNGLSRSVRYASTFLVNNYKQAIEILDTEESLKYAMEQAGVTEDMLKTFGEGSTANGNTRRHACENTTRRSRQFKATERRLSIEVRSKAIRSALQRYNSAALALDPPRQHLSWEEVIDYAFLADFDILRDPTGNAIIRAWADPAARQLLDSYHKLKRAKEEIQRLDIEIRRVVTYMKDEREFLLAKEAEILPEPYPRIFHWKYRQQRGRYDEIHMKRFYAIHQKLGSRFTADLTPGERADPTSASPSPETDVIPTVSRVASCLNNIRSGAMDVDMDLASDDEGSQNGWLDGDGSSDDDEGEDARGEELGEVMEGVALLALDKQGIGR